MLEMVSLGVVGLPHGSQSEGCYYVYYTRCRAICLFLQGLFLSSRIEAYENYYTITV